MKLNTGVLSVVMFEFYAAEVERLNNVIDLIKTDLQLCLDVIDSDAEVCYCNCTLSTLLLTRGCKTAFSLC